MSKRGVWVGGGGGMLGRAGVIEAGGGGAGGFLTIIGTMKGALWNSGFALDMAVIWL